MHIAVPRFSNLWDNSIFSFSFFWRGEEDFQFHDLESLAKRLLHKRGDTVGIKIRKNEGGGMTMQGRIFIQPRKIFTSVISHAALPM